MQSGFIAPIFWKCKIQLQGQKDFVQMKKYIFIYYKKRGHNKSNCCSNLLRFIKSPQHHSIHTFPVTQATDLPLCAQQVIITF